MPLPEKSGEGYVTRSSRAVPPARHQPLTDEDIEALLLAKSECYSIATASPDEEEIVADFQDMARNAWEQLQKVTAKLSREQS